MTIVISSEHRRNDRAFPACVTNLHDRRQFATDDNWARLCAPSITRKAKGVSIKTTMEELVPLRGWRGYFGFCETPEVLIALTRWVRLRLRAALWRQWKTPRRRRAALIALRVSGELRNTAGSGRGPWYIARSKALSVGLSNAYFKSLGLPTLIETR